MSEHQSIVKYCYDNLEQLNEGIWNECKHCLDNPDIQTVAGFVSLISLTEHFINVPSFRIQFSTSELCVRTKIETIMSRKC